MCAQEEANLICEWIIGFSQEPKVVQNFHKAMEMLRDEKLRTNVEVHNRRLIAKEQAKQKKREELK